MNTMSQFITFGVKKAFFYSAVKERVHTKITYTQNYIAFDTNMIPEPLECCCALVHSAEIVLVSSRPS